MNDLFSGDLSEHDNLVFVVDVVKGKMLESDTLAQQAASNSKAEFDNWPDLMKELTNAVIRSLDATTAMSTRALDSEAVRRHLLAFLFNHTDLYESMRRRAA